MILDRYAGALTTQINVGRGFYSADGGSLTVSAPEAAGVAATLNLVVASDSTAGQILALGSTGGSADIRFG